MKNKNTIVKNYLYNAVYQIFSILAPLITMPYVSRVLGATGIGSFSYTESIASYFILFGALGGNLYGQREVAYVQDDPDRRTLVFKEIITFRIITVLAATIIYIITFCRTGQYKNFFLILILEVMSSGVDVSWFFQGVQDFKKPVMRNIIIKFLSIVLIFLLVKSEHDTNRYTLCYALPVFISNLSLWFYLPNYITKVKPKKIITFKHLIPLLTLFIPQVATEVYTVLDKTMIGVLSSDIRQVAFYEQAQKMIKVFVALITALGIVMLPKISHLFAEGKVGEIKERIINSFQFVFFLGFPLMFGIIRISYNFVPLFYGSGYTEVILLMIIMSPIILIIGISNVIGKQYLLPTKKQKAYTISVVVGAISNFTLNLCLIPKFNALGASIATVLAEMIVTLVQFAFIHKEFSLVSILRLSVKYLLIGIVMYISIYFVDSLIDSPFISIICEVIIGAIIYIGILLLLKDKIIYKAFSFIKGGNA